MNTFKDINGKTRSIEVNVATIKRVKALTGIDLLEIVVINGDKIDSSLLETLANDFMKIVDVLYAVLKPELDRDNIDDIAFGESLNGEIIENAFKALVGEIVNFFPPQKKMVLEKLLQSAEKVQKAAERNVMAFLNSGEIDKAVDREIERMDKEFQSQKSGEASTGLPESAE